jgi:hypothetical protein
MPEFDRHHILNERVTWNARPDSRALRAYPLLVPTIYRASHEELHANVPSVPLLGHHALMNVKGNFQCGNDTLSSMDNLMFAIENASKHPRAHPIERDLCHLAIHAIDLQKPYIADGLPSTRRIIT